MNKYQKALEYIEANAVQEITNSYFRKNRTLDGINFEEFDNNLTTLQKLVDKATPFKPSSVENNSQEKYGRCKCLNIVFENNNYCKHCGQALDWSEDESK